jgi:hypothetical protein
MIDTDKYEGHPPAPWVWRHKVAEYRLTANGDKEWIDIQVDEDTDPTVMALIADAPLLLEELKQLRKDRDLLWDAIRLSGTGGYQEEEIAFWHEKLLNMNEAELKEAFKGHYEDD